MSIELGSKTVCMSDHEVSTILAELRHLRSAVERIEVEVRKTNGRVNGHDTDVALLKQDVVGLKEDDSRVRDAGWRVAALIGGPVMSGFVGVVVWLLQR